MKAIIEIPEGSTEKIEIKNGVPIVDRVLSRPVPANYGYVEGTLEEDGDALDIFILSKDPLKTLDSVQFEPIGVFRCKDQGLQDDKVLAKLKGEKFTDLEIFKLTVSVGDYLMNYKKGFEVLDYELFKEQ